MLPTKHAPRGWYNLLESRHGLAQISERKTYVGRPETDWARRSALSALGNGLFHAGHHEDTLSVREAEISLERRLGAPEDHVLAMQNNLASSYNALGRLEEALPLQRDVYSGRLKLHGEEHESTLRAADNYAMSLIRLKRFKEAKRLLRKVIPVARRVLGNEHDVTLSLCEDLSRVTLLDGECSAEEKREAVRALEDTLGVMRRVLGPQHPETQRVQHNLKVYREAFEAAFPTTA